MILKIVSGSIFFQNNKFLACKKKDEKELENSSMKFNLLRIIQEENPSNIFLITVNENLCFKIWSFFQPPP